MSQRDKVNILLVDDQPAKLMTYEVILGELGENLIKASSAREALEQLLKNDVAVVLVDVCMPELNGFELAAMIREHPRFRDTAMIFISAVHLADSDRLHGYEMGAVDYVPVPVVPEVLRAKVRIFAELFRKTRQLEGLNDELERRVKERTQALEESTGRLVESERKRSLALSAGRMGSWNWDLVRSVCSLDESQYRMFGLPPGNPTISADEARAALANLVDPKDWDVLRNAYETLSTTAGAYQTEFRIRAPDGDSRWFLMSATTGSNEQGRLETISGVTLDITERKRAEEAARESEERYRTLFAAAPMAIFVCDRNAVLQYYNSRAAELWGREPECGVDRHCGSLKLWLPNGNALPHSQSPVVEVLRTGVPAHNVEVSIERPDGTRLPVLVNFSPIRNAGGETTGAIASFVDITERKRAEEMHVLLAREVDHRARNTLAVVQAIVRMTNGGSVAAYTAAVEGRISALARAHGLLSQSRWQGADLQRLVNDELAPYRTRAERALSTSGPTVLLAPSSAQTIALVLHELATNAAKYGALAHEDGVLSVTWKQEHGQLVITWSETGLAAISQPAARGFGTKVMHASVREQLRGKIEMNWRPEGLLCTVEIPNQSHSSEDPDEAAADHDAPQSESSRIFLVEDEAVVALMLEDLLTEAGHEVVGPFSTVARAMAALREAKPDGAVLDVNLLDGPVYPLAAALVAAGVPFVFSTGYDPSSIDERFKDIPILQKPVNREKLMALLPLSNASKKAAPRPASETEPDRAADPNVVRSPRFTAA